MMFSMGLKCEIQGYVILYFYSMLPTFMYIIINQYESELWVVIAAASVGITI